MLCYTGPLVGRIWYLVRRFVAVPPRRKDPGWIKVVKMMDRSIQGVDYQSFQPG